MPRVSGEAKARLEGARRAQILAAAAQVFARRGFDRATVTEIARTAGLSEGSIYNYFRSKDELLMHIPRHLVLPELTPLLERSPATPDEMEALLLRIGAAAVERVRANTKFIKVFFSALPRLNPAVREAYARLLPPVYAATALERLLREGMRHGYLRRDLNPVIASRALPGMMMFMLMLQEIILGRRVVPFNYDEIMEEAVRVFLYGAVPRPRPVRPRDAAERSGTAPVARTREIQRRQKPA